MQKSQATSLVSCLKGTTIENFFLLIRWQITNQFFSNLPGMFCEGQTGKRGRWEGVDNEKQISIFCLPQIENKGSLAQVRRLSKKQCPASVYLELQKRGVNCPKGLLNKTPRFLLFETY